MSTPARKFTVVSKQVELLLKVGTVGLGALYVLGLLITNIQLMGLGIADFSSLRTRNVMIGFAFLFYLVLLCLVLTPGSLTLGLFFHVFARSRIRGVFRKILACAGLLLLCLFVTFSLGSLAGTLMGYLYPSGRPWLYVLRSDIWTWKFQLGDAIRTLRQLSETYWRPKTIVSAFMIIMFAMLPLYELFGIARDRFNRLITRLTSGAESPSNQEMIETASPDAFDRKLKALAASYFKWFSYVLLPLALPLLLFDYADAVYPNLLYNLGGGQPRIAKLHVEKKEKSFYTLFDLQPPSDEIEQMVATSPVVLWYQDEAFIYLSPVPNAVDAPTKVIAVDSKIVQAIDYLHGYAKIGPGGQILGVDISNRGAP